MYCVFLTHMFILSLLCWVSFSLMYTLNYKYEEDGEKKNEDEGLQSIVFKKL